MNCSKILLYFLRNYFKDLLKTRHLNVFNSKCWCLTPFLLLYFSVFLSISLFISISFLQSLSLSLRLSPPLPHSLSGSFSTRAFAGLVWFPLWFIACCHAVWHFGHKYLSTYAMCVCVCAWVCVCECLFMVAPAENCLSITLYCKVELTISLTLALSFALFLAVFLPLSCSLYLSTLTVVSHAMTLRAASRVAKKCLLCKKFFASPATRHKELRSLHF